MGITSLLDLAKGLPSSTDRTQRNQQASLARLSAGNKLASGISQDLAAFSVAVGISTQVSGLRSAATNIAQASSLLQVADGGADAIQQGLERLAELATQANNGTLSADNRAALQQEADAIVVEIDRQASQTSFNGKILLDGSVNAETAGNNVQVGDSTSDAIGLSIGDFSSSNLLGGATIDLSSSSAAATSLEAIQSALQTATSYRADIGSQQSRFEIAGAAVDSAIQNQEAARSNLTDTDYAEESTLSALLNVQSQSGVALLAQANKLQPSILSLLNG